MSSTAGRVLSTLCVVLLVLDQSTLGANVALSSSAARGAGGAGRRATRAPPRTPFLASSSSSSSSFPLSPPLGFLDVESAKPGDPYIESTKGGPKAHPCCQICTSEFYRSLDFLELAPDVHRAAIKRFHTWHRGTLARRASARARRVAGLFLQLASTYNYDQTKRRPGHGGQFAKDSTGITPIKDPHWANLAKEEAALMVRRIKPGPEDWRDGHIFVNEAHPKKADCCILCPNSFMNAEGEFSPATPQGSRSKSMTEQEIGGQGYTDFMQVLAKEFRAAKHHDALFRGAQEGNSAAATPGMKQGGGTKEVAEKRKTKTLPEAEAAGETEVAEDKEATASKKLEATIEKDEADMDKILRASTHPTLTTHPSSNAASTAARTAPPPSPQPLSSGGVHRFKAAVREGAGASAKNGKVKPMDAPTWSWSAGIHGAAYPYSSRQLTPGLMDTTSNGIGPHQAQPGQQTGSIYNALHPFLKGETEDTGDTRHLRDKAQNMPVCCGICDQSVHDPVDLDDQVLTLLQVQEEAFVGFKGALAAVDIKAHAATLEAVATGGGLRVSANAETNAHGLFGRTAKRQRRDLLQDNGPGGNTGSKTPTRRVEQSNMYGIFGAKQTRSGGGDCCRVCPVGILTPPFGEPDTYLNRAYAAPGGMQNMETNLDNQRKYSEASDPTICEGCRLKDQRKSGH